MQPFTFFISYRRIDTAPIALLLKNEIEKRLQFVRVSVDVDEVKIGDNFPEHLERLISYSHATIPLISKHWMPRREEKNQINTGIDWVLHELKFSKTAPLAMNVADRLGLKKRLILPLFVDCNHDFKQFVIPDSISYVSELQSEHIDYASWPSTIGPLLDRIAVKFNLKKRPDADEYPKPDIAKARTQPLPDKELISILGYEDYEGWYIDNFGNSEVRYIVKTFKFSGFNKAADFMQLVSEHCKILDHHPEWKNIFNHVTVSLTTWDAQRRVTIYDLNLALYMNMAEKAIKKRK